MTLLKLFAYGSTGKVQESDYSGYTAIELNRMRRIAQVIAHMAPGSAWGTIAYVSLEISYGPRLVKAKWCC